MKTFFDYPATLSADQLSRGSEDKRQSLRPQKQEAIELTQRLILYHAHILQLLKQHAKRHFGFQSRQGCTNTEMNAVSEPLVPIRRAGYIKAFRVGKHSLIEVHRIVIDPHVLSRTDSLPSQASIDCSNAPFDKLDARIATHGMHIAQDLLDRFGQESRILPQLLKRLRVFDKAQNGIAEQVGSGNVARNEERETEAHQFHETQALPLHLCCDKQAQDILLRMLLVSFNGLREDLPEALNCLRPFRALVDD